MTALDPAATWRRLWQPRRPLFWLVIVFNALASTMAWTLHLTQASGVLQALLVAGALVNSVLGWWLLARLWRETSADAQGDKHVQGPADQQDR